MQNDKKLPTLKEAFEFAFTEMQTDPKSSLLAWGKANPSAFYPLAVKIITANDLQELLEPNTVNISIIKKQAE
ncbi:MAG TPA: hypothetical protein VK835_00675 [Bacteroidia bacterium]|nr:hypothetical protein [Bacteroidia bacterium]